MRALLLLIALVGCEGDDSTLCDDLEATQSACMNEENLVACRAAVDECGDDVLVMESCPLQFGCP